MSSATQSPPIAGDVTVRGMREADLPDVARIVRVAFGTFFGLPDPQTLWPDRDPITTRWRAAPDSSLVAVVNGRVIGSNFLTNWGSVAFFGPLTIEPEFWNQGVAQKLLGPTVDQFDKWGAKDSGLFTFAQSTKHVNLYQKFGYWPRFLTAVMSKTVDGPASVESALFSELNEAQRQEAVAACAEVTGAITDGLDVRVDILSVRNQNLGDTVLIWSGDALDAFAVCHCGPGTEAGADICYLKFAAVRPGKNAGRAFDQLLLACEGLTASRGLHRVEAGINLGRSAAYRAMLAHGFRSQMQGVAMHRPDSPGYSRPEVYVIDDWR
ncbi:MAG TPA: GNAT family N-acetyltransferase [Bryobacteraceae bacterium]|nr:GNAT family N-acetyltransferase [Bryobacteraceae bacterium]